MQISREVPSIYLRAVVLRILTHWAVQKMTTTEQDMEIGLTSYLIAVSLPVGQGGRKPALVIKVVIWENAEPPAEDDVICIVEVEEVIRACSQNNFPLQKLKHLEIILDN